MIKRESYMKRIRPFFGNDLVKALIGLHRSGKSVMLDLIKEELCASGVSSSQFISINFENMRNAHLCTAVALHDEIIRRASEIKDKVYLFFDEIQEVDAWEKCINSFRVELDCDIYITGSNAKLLSGELATYLACGFFMLFPIFSSIPKAVWKSTKDLMFFFVIEIDVPHIASNAIIHEHAWLF